MIGCASAEQLLASLDQEAGSQSRFPVRFILVSGIRQWQQLLPQLSARVDAVIKLSSLCAGDDSLPYMPDLLLHLRQASAPRVLVLPLGEVLRLKPDAVPELASLAQLEKVGKQRIYIPLFDVGDLFQQQMGQVPRYTSGTLPPVWSLAGGDEGRLVVAPAALGPGAAAAAVGIRAYLQAWEKGETPPRFLATRLAPSLRSRLSSYRVDVYADTFQLLRASIRELDAAKPAWGSESQWRWLGERAGEGDSLAHLAARELAVRGYDADHLFALWPKLSAEKRWLLWLWSKLEAHRRGVNDHYALLAVHTSESVSALPLAAATANFGRDLPEQALQQRQVLLRDLGLESMPPEFWQEFERLADPLTRLKALADLSDREREEAVRATAELLRNGTPPEQWLPYLKVAYRHLATYLTAFPFSDPQLQQYFQLYARSRVCDELSPELAELARELAAARRIWSFEARGAKVEAQREQGALPFWVDALGLEWVGLLRELLRDSCAVSLEVARANLPTTTEFNREWGDDQPPRDLDKEAHAYDYALPRSLVREIAAVNRIAAAIRERLRPGQTLLVTSDHGLTRFASQGRVVALPDGWAPHKWGRYAEPVTGAPDLSLPEDVCLRMDGRAILAVHGHFDRAGAPKGQAHGGATLEECLVPLLLVRLLEATLPAFSFELLTPDVRLDARGFGRLQVKVSAGLPSLTLRLPQAEFVGQPTGGGIWEFALSGLPLGAYRGRLESEGRPPEQIEFRLSRGLTENDLGL